MERLTDKEKIQLEKYIETKCKDLRFIYDFQNITGTFADIKIKSIEKEVIILSVSYVEEFDTLGRDKLYSSGDPFQYATSKFFKPTISYNYLNINIIPKYCFNQTDFNESDYKIYFEKLKVISNTPLSELEEIKDRTLDFKIYTGTVKKELIDCFKTIIGRKDLRNNQIPHFGRIGLYNGEKKGDKAPRVFFFVGHYSTLHILLFDPYHDIYPDYMSYAKS